ncbi:antibiotic biosynthesis monooxygenase [Vibrio harveyi]|uniref:putative quinol monooxygenase n=1 Tax=Vibrio harveyi TaxID=669 RepID=UPI00248110E6|nr:putative quinol monooxygenase [Vibrio harveyi]
MSNINIIATLHTSAFSKESVRTAMKTVESLSRLEDGCIKYDLYEISEEFKGLPSTGGDFLVIETWKDQESLDRHAKSEHFLNLVSKFNEEELKITVQIINKLK